jgi:hypothetical protein
MVQADFRRILDDHQALGAGDLLDQGVEQRGLAAAGAAGDDDGLAARHGGLEEGDGVALVQQLFELGVGGLVTGRIAAGGFLEEAVVGEVFQAHVGEQVLAHRHGQAAAGGRRGDHLHAGAVRQGGGEQGLFAVDALVAGGGDLAGQALQRLFGKLVGGLAAHHAGGGLDPHLARSVDQDVGDVRTRQPRRQRRQIGVEINACRHPAWLLAEPRRTCPPKPWRRPIIWIRRRRSRGRGPRRPAPARPAPP